MSSRDALSMYVPARNAAATLPDCLAAIRAQTHRPDELLIVVDPRSTDGTLDLAQRSGATVLIQTGATLGAARNQAIAAAGHRWLACCDADVVLDRHWLASLAARRGQGLAGIGGRTEERVRSPADAWRALHMPLHWGEYPLRNPYTLGSDTLFDRQALLAVGGYRDDLNYCEDGNLCRRLRDAGYGLFYEPAATATHQRTDTPTSVLTLRWRHSELQHRDLLERFGGLLQKMQVNRDYAFNALARSVSRSQEELSYLAVLLYFHHLLMDLLALLSRRLLVPPQDRGGYGQELAKLAFELLERRDRVLAGYVREDLQPICRMFPAGSGSRKTPNWTAHSATAGQSIWAFLKELDDTTLGLLISSARYLRGWPDPIQRLPAPSREGLQAVLADIPVAPAIDAALAGAVRRIWPDVGKVRVLGRITDPEVAALNEAFTPPPNVPEVVAVVAHLETEPDPLLAFKTLDPGARRLVVSYRPPPTYVPGLDIPSAGDLASTGAAAGWQIERFETLVGRTCLFLSR